MIHPPDSDAYWRVPTFLAEPRAARDRALRALYARAARTPWDAAAGSLEYADLRSPALPINVNWRPTPAPDPAYRVGGVTDVLADLRSRGRVAPQAAADLLVWASSELWFALAVFAMPSRTILYQDTEEQARQSRAAALGVLRNVDRHWPAVAALGPRMDALVPGHQAWPYFGLGVIKMFHVAGMAPADADRLRDSPMDEASRMGREWLARAGASEQPPA